MIMCFGRFFFPAGAPTSVSLCCCTIRWVSSSPRSTTVVPGMTACSDTVYPVDSFRASTMRTKVSALKLSYTWYIVQGASLRKEKYHQITMRSGQWSMIEYSFFMIVVANWRLDNAKRPPAMLQEKTARTARTLRLPVGCRTYVHTPGRVCTYFLLLMCCMYEKR